MSDAYLKNESKRLQKVIADLTRKYGYKDFWFKNFLEYYQDEPTEGESCITVMTFDGRMLEALEGYNGGGFHHEFCEVVEKAGFYFEKDNHYVMRFYSSDDELSLQYRNYLEWQWITYLIQPEYTSLYNELYSFFEKSPDKLYSLKPRQFEFYTAEIFRNQGYDVEIGPGLNDGGVDLRLYQKKEIDQVTTLVQVKRYKNNLPIRLDAVAALYGHVEAEKANEGLFITTSRYLPGVKKFADRLSKKVALYDSNDVVAWSNKIKTTILRDKSQLISDESLLKLVDGINSGVIKNAVLIHNHHSGAVYNEFALLLKETKFVALIMMLPKKNLRVIDPPYNTRGYEIPVLDCSVLNNKISGEVFRANIGIGFDGFKTYSGRGKYFSL